MNFRGIKVGKIIETTEDLMEHSYPLAPKVSLPEPIVESVTVPVVENVTLSIVETQQIEVEKPQLSDVPTEAELSTPVDKIIAEIAVESEIKSIASSKNESKPSSGKNRKKGN